MVRQQWVTRDLDGKGWVQREMGGGCRCGGGGGSREAAACCHPAVCCLKAFSGVNLPEELEALLVATYFLPSAGSPPPPPQHPHHHHRRLSGSPSTE